MKRYESTLSQFKDSMDETLFNFQYQLKFNENITRSTQSGRVAKFLAERASEFVFLLKTAVEIMNNRIL